MRLTTIAAFAAALSVAGLAAAAPAHGPPTNFPGRQFSAQAKITMAQAEAIALKAHPGKITDKELEKESGGSSLRYSFDISSRGVTYEVGVDAKTGKVLQNGREGPNPD